MRIIATMAILVLLKVSIFAQQNNENIYSKHTFFETKTMSYKTLYDELLPYLIRMAYTQSEDSLEKQISNLNDFLYTWNSINMYEDFYGLGTGGIIMNTSNILSFDKMYCSEIDLLAAVPFRIKHDYSRLDVTSHTLYEVVDNSTGRRIMIDPLYNPKIVNKKGQLATFEELSNFDKYKLKSLRMSDEEFKNYAKLFQKKYNKAQSKEAFDTIEGLRKTSFGERKYYDKLFKDKVWYMPIDKYLPALKANGIDPSTPKKYNFSIIAEYHVSFLYAMYQYNNKKDSRYIMQQVQDVLLNKIKENYYGKIWSKQYYNLWEARQYQILGRFDIAEKRLKKLFIHKNINKNQINDYIEIGKKLKKQL